MPSPAPPAPPCRAHSALPTRRQRARASPSTHPAPIFAAGALAITNPGARLRGDGRGGQRRTGEREERGQGTRPHNGTGASPDCEELWGPQVLRG